MISHSSTTAVRFAASSSNSQGEFSRPNNSTDAAAAPAEAVTPPHASRALEPGGEEAVSGVVLLNMRLQPIAADRGASSILRTYSHNLGSAHQKVIKVPDEVLAEIGSRQHLGQSGSSAPITFGGGRYRCRFYLIQSENPTLKGGLIALHLDTIVESCDPLSAVMTAYHLTEREGEALRGIALGLSTKEMADRMGISPNTVKSFVRLIMIKLNVTSRAAIMVKLLEKNGNR